MRMPILSICNSPCNGTCKVLSGTTQVENSAKPQAEESNAVMRLLHVAKIRTHFDFFHPHSKAYMPSYDVI